MTTSKPKKAEKIKAPKIKNKSKSNKEAIEELDNDSWDRGDRPMSIIGHLEELRSRLIISLVTITVITLGSFFLLSGYLLDIINSPFIKTGLKLNIFNLSEGFLLRAKASLIMGIFVGLPVIVFELWKYIAPAINKKDRKFIFFAILASVFLLYGGMTLTYFFLLPIAIQMLLSFTPDNMNNIIDASKYLNFVLLFSLAMGIMCELPIAIMILTKIGIITPKFLISKRKYAIVLIWIAAAILTPGPDVLSQALVAIPIMLLYEISIIISKIITRRKIKEELT